MSQSASAHAVPEEIASQLCTEIRRQWRGLWYTPAAVQCMGCSAASRGDLARMGPGDDAPGFLCCNEVIIRYDSLFQAGSRS
jgi:hypothetical protein